VSGFLGIVRSDGQEIAQEWLEKIGGVLRFRGMDGERIWRQERVGTCFAYCATDAGKQSAQQPVKLGGKWLLGDVRVDARRELVEELAKSGTRVAEGTTSEELILQAWQTWGESCLEQILGDYSFALWNDGEQCLWCARDFIGARPFYYTRGNKIFCFSNSLEAIRAVPEVGSELDETFVGEFLLHGYSSDLTRTVYSQIRRLPAGHLLKLKSETIDVRRFLKLPIEEPVRFTHPEEYLEGYRDVVDRAVADRLPAGPCAMYLSGGLDSGSVCAVASRVAAGRGNKDLLKAFTVGWNPLFDDPEPHYAALSAKYLGVAHEILEEENFALYAEKKESERATPEPNIEAFFSRAQGQYLRIAEHSAVILSGDGGDDVLTGQAWPYFAKLWASGEWPEILRSIGSFAWSHGKLPPLRVGIRAKVFGAFGKRREWDGYPQWLNQDFESRNGLRDKWRAKARKPETVHPIHPRAYESLHEGFWSTILESEDAGNTNVRLETRAPLLDLRVLRFQLRVPPVPWCMDKELTRRALKGYLPEDILERPKTPLVRDPLEVCLEGGRWPTKWRGEPPTRINGYINWQQWIETLESSKGYNPGAALYALAFGRWLKDVENG
jgi:asparagine synthase (glutamine-hydrolysing)